jgi:hypothetical protein
MTTSIQQPAARRSDHIRKTLCCQYGVRPVAAIPSGTTMSAAVDAPPTDDIEWCSEFRKLKSAPARPPHGFPEQTAAPPEPATASITGSRSTTFRGASRCSNHLLPIAAGPSRFSSSWLAACSFPSSHPPPRADLLTKWSMITLAIQLVGRELYLMLLCMVVRLVNRVQSSVPCWTSDSRCLLRAYHASYTQTLVYSLHGLLLCKQSA